MSTEVAGAPAAPVAQLQALRRIAIVPAYNEELNVGRVLAELRQFDPGLDVVVVSDGSTDRTAEVAEAARRARRSSCRSTSASAAPSRRRSATPGRRATSSPCGSTATASTTPTQLGIVVAPVLAGEADIAVGSRFIGAGGYRSSAARRVGIRVLAWVVSTIARQKVTDTTSGFQALNRRAIGLYAADLPHDYPEVEGLVMAIRHRVRLTEVPVTMREREHGRSSISALGSVYYMVKILLALFVGLFRRKVTPTEDA